MKRTILAAGLLLLAAVAPVQDAAAHDEVLGGALLGGILGGVIGGAATGRGSGAAVGAVVGAATGALIASQAHRNRYGYYPWRGGCYVQRWDGAWLRAPRRYCYY